MVMIQRCTSPIWALSLCWFRIILFCTIWEIQPDHKVKYLLRHYHCFMNLQVCNVYHISSIRLKTQRRIPSICILSLWMDSHAPMYALGETAWTSGRIIHHFFMNWQKSIIFTIVRQFKPKHNVAHLQYQFFCGLMQNTPVYTFGDIAWIRGRLFTKFLSFFMNLKSLSFL